MGRPSPTCPTGTALFCPTYFIVQVSVPACINSIRGIQVASFLRLYFGPICKRRTALKHPEIVVKKKNSPEPVPTHGTWRAVLQCEIWSLNFCLSLNMMAVLLFAQVPWIGTEILLLWPRFQGLSLIGRWDQSKPEKMTPLGSPWYASIE